MYESNLPNLVAQKAAKSGGKQTLAVADEEGGVGFIDAGQNASYDMGQFLCRSQHRAPSFTHALPRQKTDASHSELTKTPFLILHGATTINFWSVFPQVFYVACQCIEITSLSLRRLLQVVTRQ